MNTTQTGNYRANYLTEDEVGSRERLIEELLTRVKEKEPNTNKEEFIYCLYARKSSEGEDAQAGSIEQQIEICTDYAGKHNLKIGGIFKESKSARKSGERPVFQKILEDFENETSKFDGILAWHPNRLARNMREGGIIIDLIDDYLIADLQFPTYTFTNDPSGKLVLAITFAMAKDYSDGLGLAVKRGKADQAKKGTISNLYIHGYKHNERFQLIPDGNNWEIMRKAFEMRVNRNSLQDIIKFIHQNDYRKYVREKDERGTITFEGNKLFEFTTSSLSKVFSNTIYSGVLQSGKTIIDLLDVNPYFVPMISVDKHKQISKNLNSNFELFRGRTDTTEYTVPDFLRDTVICPTCGAFLTAYEGGKKLVSKSKKRKNLPIFDEDTGEQKKYSYMYFRCHNKTCITKSKSYRANIVVEFALDCFDVMRDKLPCIFEIIKDDLIAGKEFDIENLKIEIRSLNQEIVEMQKKINNIDQRIEKVTDESEDIVLFGIKDFIKLQSQQKLELSIKLSEIQVRMENKKIELSDLKTIENNFEEFYENWQKLLYRLYNHAVQPEVSKAIKLLFTKIYIDGSKVVNYELSSEFTKLDQVNVSTFGGRGIRTPGTCIRLFSRQLP